jgi:hypothetical protein
MNLILEETIDLKGNFPVLVHGDNSPIYKGEEFQKGLINLGLQFSSSIVVKHGNQVCESYNNRLKQQVALNCLQEKSQRSAKKEFLTQLSYSQRKMNTMKKSRNSEVRKILFQTVFFKSTAYENIQKSIEEINPKKHTVYKN